MTRRRAMRALVAVILPLAGVNSLRAQDAPSPDPVPPGGDAGPKAADVRPPTRSLGEPAKAFAVAPDGKHLAACGRAYEVTVWSSESAKPVRVIHGEANGWVDRVFLRGDPLRLFVEQAGGEKKRPLVAVYDVASGTYVGSLASLPCRPDPDGPNPGTRGNVSIIGDLPALGAFVVSYRDMGALLADPVKWRVLEASGVTLPPRIENDEIESHLHRHATDVTCSPDGARLAFELYSNVSVETWPAGTQVWRTDAWTPEPDMTGIVCWFHPRFVGSGRFVACDLTVRPETGAEGHDSVICCDVEKNAVVWRVPRATLLDAAPGAASQVLVSMDGAVRLLDGGIGRVLKNLAAADDHVQFARFAPDGAWVWLVSGNKGTVAAVAIPKPGPK